MTKNNRNGTNQHKTCYEKKKWTYDEENYESIRYKISKKIINNPVPKKNVTKAERAMGY